MANETTKPNGNGRRLTTVFGLSGAAILALIWVTFLEPRIDTKIAVQAATITAVREVEQTALYEQLGRIESAQKEMTVEMKELRVDVTTLKALMGKDRAR